ncbi:MAG: hypothetical protein Q9208_002193 [Pyrenodesmia sp. 3 TL-2023]
MKYGDTLQQRSIPEWEHYNVDYNDLKSLIRRRTTRGQGEALTIPGHSNETKALQVFEDEFFFHLVDQHQRVDLFVQSKAGEINRRLAYLDKQIGQLHQRYALRRTGRISVRGLERYSKAEELALQAGEEIRSLARFVGAQRVAFIKLLKKYSRWTSSSALDQRFRKKVLERPSAFSKKDFEPLLTQYEHVLAAVRAPFEGVSGKTLDRRGSSTGDHVKLINASSRTTYHASEQHDIRSNPGARKPHNSRLMDIQAACQLGSDVEFDAALAISPLGKCGGRAAYWVHPDNLVELHVLLLQYLKLRRTHNSSVAAPAAHGSHQESGQESTNGKGSFLGRDGDDDAGLVVCDDLPHFARRQSSALVSDTETSTGERLEKAAATIRYSSGDEAVVVVNALGDDTAESKTSGTTYRVKIRRDRVRQLFRSAKPTSLADKFFGENDKGTVDCVQKRLHRHREVKPLVQLQCKRTRFVGLKNGETLGMWATLDRNILMKRTPDDFFETDQGDLNIRVSRDCHSVEFPFAVLEVRYGGGYAMDLLSVLDETHLTERIRGFSMQTHAVATLGKPPGMPPPYWLPVLDQDLRKLPATAKTATSRTSSKHLSPGSSTVGRASTSATSVGEAPACSDSSMPTAESPATSIPVTPEAVGKGLPQRKRRIREYKPPRQQVAASGQPNHQGYWNEYDNGDEDSDNEPFAIYIDPNKPTFPKASRFASALLSHAKASSKKVRLWLRSSEEPTKHSSAPADDDNPYFRHVANPEDDSDLDDSPTDPLPYHTRHRQYSTFHDGHQVERVFRERESLLARCCIAFFVASFALLAVASLLAATGRRKALFKVNVGVTTGVISSLVFSIAGVVSMFKRREHIGAAPKILAFAAVGLVCIGSGVQLASVVDG